MRMIRTHWSEFRQRHPRATLGAITTGALSLLLSVFLLYIHIFNKCDMQAVLLPLLQQSIPILQSVKDAQFFTDYGTLLGLIRDNGIIPHDFDVDMSMIDIDCPKFSALQPEFARIGLRMYVRGEYIPMKQNTLLGYDGYLHKACARIYDADSKYYIDFDMYKRYTYDEAIKTKQTEEAAGRHFRLPDGYQESDGDLICNLEAFENEPGGCRLVSWIFPLKNASLLGVPLTIPAQPETNLVAIYGQDWQIPRAKGYKVLICSWIPIHDNMKFFFLWLIVSAIPAAAYYFIPWIWHQFLVLTGHRSTHSYAALPIHAKPSRLRADEV